MKKSVTCSPEAMQHPWVKGALAVTGNLRKAVMDLKQQVNKLEEENRILRGIIAKNITSPPPKKETLINGYGHSPWKLPSLGELPRYRITITTLLLSFFLVRSFRLYLDLVE